MTAAQIVSLSLDYLAFISPYLVIMFAVAFAKKLIDFAYAAIQDYRSRRW